MLGEKDEFAATEKLLKELESYVLIHDKKNNEESTSNVEGQQEVTEPVKTFNCYVCFEKFPTNIDLYNHHLKHAIRSAHSCDICMKRFPNRAVLLDHKSNSHKKFICKTCYRGFDRRNQLVTHQITHLPITIKLR